jgi:Mitochondrial carrier protein
MNIPWASILVGVNETLKQLVLTENNHTFFTYFWCASLAASIASICTIPLDNIKTRLQTQTCHHSCSREIGCVLKSESMQHTFDFNKCKQLFFKSKIFCIGRTTRQAFTTKKLEELKGGRADDCFNEQKRIKYRNISESVKIIYKEEGLRGFSKGILPRLCGQAPSAATSWAAYETMKGFLEKKWAHQSRH